MLKKTNFLLLFILLSICESVRAEPIFIFKHDKKQGIKNSQGDILIPAIYDSLVTNSNHEYTYADEVIFRKGKFWGIVKLTNKLLVKPIYLHLQKVGDNRFIAEEKKASKILTSFGLINKKGKVIIPFKYFRMESHGEFLLASKKTKAKIQQTLFDANSQILQTSHQITPLGQNRFSIRKTNGKVKVYRADINQTYRISCDKVDPFVYSVAKFYLNGFVGQIDLDGNILSEPKFKAINRDSENLFYKKWTVFNPINKESKTLEGDSIRPYSQGYVTVWRNKKNFLYNKEMKLVAKGILLESAFEHNTAVASGLNKKYGIINRKGEWLLNPSFDSILRIDENNYIRSSRNKYGKLLEIFDYNLKVKIKYPCQNYAFLSEEKFILSVQKNRLWGVIDQIGSQVLQCKYDTIHSFSKDKFKVTYWGKEGYVDTLGLWSVMPHKGKLKEDVNQNYILKNYFGNYILNAKGQEIFFSYNPLESFETFYLERKYNNTFRIVKKDGKYLNPTWYESISVLEKNKSFLLYEKEFTSIFSKQNGFIRLNKAYRNIKSSDVYESGYISIDLNSNEGLINSNGNLVITNRYERVRAPQDDRFAFQLNGKWGFLDKNENIIIQPWFAEVTDFKNNFSVVKKANLYGIYNKIGQKIIEVKYDLIKRNSRGDFISKKNGKYGYINSKAQTVLHPNYENLSINKIGIITKRNKVCGLSSFSGLELIPSVYVNIEYLESINLIVCENTKYR